MGLNNGSITNKEGFICGEADREGQRIRHILVIIRNICQDQHDVHIVRRSETVLKFLLRCSFIHNDIGLGKRSNIATQTAELLSYFFEHKLTSYKVEQALETISILLQVDKADKSLEPPGRIEKIIQNN